MAFLKEWRRTGTHRLIPAKYSESGSVLEKLPLAPEVLEGLSELDGATNGRILAETNLNPAIGPGELLYGVPKAAIVNAAFSHASASGGRFNDAMRGAWYASEELQSSQAEVAFHKRRFLEETRFTGQAIFEYADFLADFAAQFHRLTAEEKKTCLQAEPVPECYAKSQVLAKALLHSGSNGIVYPSVREPGGSCIACFRPALVHSPRRGLRYALTVGKEDKWKVLRA